MKKRIIAFLLLSVLLAAAFGVKAQPDKKYVYDEIEALSSQELYELNGRAQQIYDRFGISVMFALCYDTGEQGVQPYLKRLFEATAGNSSGIIVGLDDKADRWSAYRAQKCEELLSEDDEDALFEAYNKSDTYVGGIKNYFDLAEKMLEEALGVPNGGSGSTIGEAPRSFGNRVEDAADILNDEQRAALSAKLADISARHNCDVVIITASTLDGKSPRLYGADYYEACGYAKNGMVMLVYPAGRDYAFIATGSGMTALTNDAIELLEEKVRDDELANDRYYAAFNKFADHCDDFLTRAENGKPYKKKLIPIPLAIIGAGVIGAVSGAVVTGGMKRKLHSVAKKATASDYLKKDSLNIRNADEIFLYKNLTRTAIPKETRSSGGGSSGGFSSSSGSSWSGSSGKY